MNDNALLTTHEVIDYLRIDLRTLYRQIRDGRIPAMRVGRQWRFRRADLEACLDYQPTSHGNSGNGNVGDGAEDTTVNGDGEEQREEGRYTMSPIITLVSVEERESAD